MASAALPRKNNASKDLTKGSPIKLIVEFAIPILLSQLFQQLYNTADTLIVGRFLGTEALAAVRSSGTLIHLMISFFNGTAMGAGIVIAKYFGAGDDENVSKAVHTDVAFGFVASIFLTIVGVLLTPTFLVWMKTDPEVLPDAIEYFRYYFIGITCMIMYNILIGIMNSVGDSKRPLYYLIISSCINVGLDILFVGGFKWGVWAAAVATVISQGISVVLCFIHLCKKGNSFSFEFKKMKFHKDILRDIIRYGLPSGVQNSVISFANVIVQTQINSFGTYATAAYGAHMKIEGFVFLPIMSFNTAVSTFISQNLGAREHDRAKYGAKFGIMTVVLLAETLGVIYYTLSPYLISFFDSTPEVVQYGVSQARVEALFYCLLAFSHAVAAVCRGAGKAFVPMTVMLSIWCVLRIAYIETVTHMFHMIQLIYWAYPLTWFLSTIVYAIYITKSDWVHGFDR